MAAAINPSTFLFHGPARARNTVILAHGAGAPAQQAMPHWTPPLRVQYLPHPRDYVRIEEAVGPYTVPVGKLFVVVGSYLEGGGNLPILLVVDGVNVVFHTSLAWPEGLVYQPGQVIAADDMQQPPSVRGVITGYLADL